MQKRTSISIYINYMEKSSLDIFLNISFCVSLKKKKDAGLKLHEKTTIITLNLNIKKIKKMLVFSSFFSTQMMCSPFWADYHTEFHLQEVLTQLLISAENDCGNPA